MAADRIRDVDWDPVAAGSPRTARLTEPFALVVVELECEREGGPELAYRFERFGEQA